LRYLIDTDWIIKYLRGNEKTIKVLNSLYDEGLAISIISFAEIYEGIYRFNGKKQEELETNFINFLNGVKILNIDKKIGKIFAEQRVNLRVKNKLIDNFDLLIGSTALCYDLTLLTNNIKHFERIETIKISNIDKF